MRIASPVAGLRPIRAGRLTLTNLANPVMATGSPCDTTGTVTTSVKPSRTLDTVLRSTSACTATALASSLLFMGAYCALPRGPTTQVKLPPLILVDHAPLQAMCWIGVAEASAPSCIRSQVHSRSGPDPVQNGLCDTRSRSTPVSVHTGLGPHWSRSTLVSVHTGLGPHWSRSMVGEPTTSLGITVSGLRSGERAVLHHGDDLIAVDLRSDVDIPFVPGADQTAGRSTRPDGTLHVAGRVVERRHRRRLDRQGATRRLQVPEDRTGPQGVLEGGAQRSVGPPFPRGHDHDRTTRLPYPGRGSSGPRRRRWRTHAATTVGPATRPEAMVEPLGEGRTSRGVTGARLSTSGDKDHGWASETSFRRTASMASCLAANSGRGGVVPGVGEDRRRRPTTMATAVVNESTSSTTRQAASGARCAAPIGPHSKRTSESDCDNPSSGSGPGSTTDARSLIGLLLRVEPDSGPAHTARPEGPRARARARARSDGLPAHRPGSAGRCGGRDRRRSGDLTLFRARALPTELPDRMPRTMSLAAVLTGFEPTTSGLTGRRALRDCTTGPRSALAPTRCTPNGIRTRVTALKGRRPRPLTMGAGPIRALAG